MVKSFGRIIITITHRLSDYVSLCLPVIEFFQFRRSVSDKETNASILADFVFSMPDHCRAI